MATCYTTGELAARVEGRLRGRPDLPIRGLNALDHAEPGELTFIGTARHAARWSASRASAAVVTAGLDLPEGGNDEGGDTEVGDRAVIEVPDADLAMAVILGLYAPAEPVPEPGIDPSARVHSDARLADDVVVGPGCVVGPRCRLGSRTRLEANVHLGADVEIGADGILRAGVVVRDRCRLGDRVSIHPNAVIGADGFGYRPDGRGGLVKMPHIGIVEIGDDVEIGACSTIDRAKYGRTVIGSHTKIDNLVQVGHNVRIGRGCVFASQSGVAGSSVVGDHCQIAGQVGIADHQHVGDRVRIAAQSGVMRDVESGATVGGAPAVDIKDYWRIVNAWNRIPAVVRDFERRRRDDSATNGPRGRAGGGGEGS